MQELTYYASTQSPHSWRMYLSQLLDVPQHRTRVLCKDVGGAFGFKWSIYREDIAIAAASKQLGRPVKWIEDRAENLTAGGSAREETLDVDFAVTDDGTILGIRVRMTMDHGAYPAMPPAPVFAALVRATLLSAPARDRCYAFETTIVATNKSPYISYRGPGRVRDARARADDGHRRRANWASTRSTFAGATCSTRDEQPRRMPSGRDRRPCAGASRPSTRCSEHFDYAAFREEQARAREQGRYLGLGFSQLDPADARVPGLVGVDRRSRWRRTRRAFGSSPTATSP